MGYMDYKLVWRIPIGGHAATMFHGVELIVIRIIAGVKPAIERSLLNDRLSANAPQFCWNAATSSARHALGSGKTLGTTLVGSLTLFAMVSSEICHSFVHFFFFRRRSGDSKSCEEDNESE